MLSDSPEAVRARRYRDNKRKKLHAEQRHVSGTSSSTGTQTADEGQRPVELGDARANASSSSSPLHETKPFTGAGPQAFARVLTVPSDDGKAEPSVAGAPEAPPAPPTPEEVAGVAIAVAAYFEAGTMLALARHAEELAQVGINPQALAERMPVAKKFVFEATTRVAIKYGIRIPYQDEAVVIGAIGIASYGFVGPLLKKKQTDKQTAAPSAPPSSTSSKPATPAANAKANAKANPPPASSGTDPLPDVGGDFAL